MFSNRVLRIIRGPRRDEVTGEWRKLRNEELDDLYSSPSSVWVIKSRRMRWVEHVARMGKSSITCFENHAVYETIWENVLERGRPSVPVWRLLIACWIPKATNKQTNKQIHKLSHTQILLCSTY